MFTKEQKDRLTPEQLVTAERWEREVQKRIGLIDQLRSDPSNDPIECLWKIVESTQSHCEHGRSTLSTCMACDEIEKLLYGADEDDETDS